MAKAPPHTPTQGKERKERYPPFCKPPRKNEIAKPSSLPPAGKDRPTKTPTEYYISPGIFPQVSPGCIVWLPAKEHILPNAFIDRQLHANAFDHPAVILSVPIPLKHDSIVEFAIVSSFLSSGSPFTNPIKDDILWWAYTTPSIQTAP
jgi:hypothetical protein